MRNIKIYATLFFAICILPGISFGQSYSRDLLFNNGDQIFIQSGALLHVQGDVVNNYVSGQSNIITNNGILNVEGDLKDSGSTAPGFTYGVSGERTVRMIGNATQAGGTTTGVQVISGGFNTTGTKAFYNLVIDRGAAGQVVSLASPITIDGSLVWNGTASASKTATYDPTSAPLSTDISNGLFTVRGSSTAGYGIIQMYNGSTDNGITFTQPFTATSSYMAGYHTVGTYAYSGASAGSAAAATNDQYIQSRGTDATTNTGLTLTLNGTGTYTFPIGSQNKYYEPIQIYLPSAQTNALTLTCKFTEPSATASSWMTTPGTVFSNTIDMTNSSPAMTAAQIAWFNNPTNSAAITAQYSQNPGYNVYEKDCKGNPRWFIMNSLLTNLGYWSMKLNSGTLNTGSYYTIQAFPHNYTDVTTNENKRVVREDVDAFNAAPTATNFNAEVNTNMVTPSTDIITYAYRSGSYNAFTTCSTTSGDATGIPGGRYTAFSHYSIGTSSANTSEALPVDLISLTADPINNTFIMVGWATASEQQNKGFEVQRSTDGINFTTIGWVDGHGTTDEQNNYSYNDNNVEPNVQYYYRLNQLDINGNSRLTYIVSAEITAGPSITVSEWMPNPTTGAIRLVVNTTEQLPISVKFYDMLGKMVLSSSNEAAFGTNTFDFDLGGLTDGTYTASIRVGTNSYSKKVVLVK